MQASFSTHPSEAAIHRTATGENTKKVAEAALKNVPGGAKLVAETFNKGYVKTQFPLKKHVNLELHQGWGYGHQ